MILWENHVVQTVMLCDYLEPTSAQDKYKPRAILGGEYGHGALTLLKTPEMCISRESFARLVMITQQSLVRGTSGMRSESWLAFSMMRIVRLF